MSAVAHQTQSETLQVFDVPEIRAVDNYMSSLGSAAQLADVPELEKAARLLRRSLTSAKKAGCVLDYAALEARARIIQREGYIASVDRQMERAEKRAAKGDSAEAEASIARMEEYAHKARELGCIVVIDTARIEAITAHAKALGIQNADRDRVIHEHLNKVGGAFLALYDAATGGKDTL
ncbi:MAG: hypothetical protein H7Z43_07735 [Clostridia bacterium]|nr:hypothetical protein [Deltaproteobacteria bacterium]